MDPAARGLDLGTQLVRAVEAECERRGVTQLTVASRRAGGFYDRLGFHESAEYMRRFFVNRRRNRGVPRALRGVLIRPWCRCSPGSTVSSRDLVLRRSRPHTKRPR